MENVKLFLGSVKSPNKLLKLINRAKSILKIQNLFKVNKFFQKILAASLSALFVVYSAGFVSLKQVGAMDYLILIKENPEEAKTKFQMYEEEAKAWWKNNITLMNCLEILREENQEIWQIRNKYEYCYLEYLKKYKKVFKESEKILSENYLRKIKKEQFAEDINAEKLKFKFIEREKNANNSKIFKVKNKKISKEYNEKLNEIVGYMENLAWFKNKKLEFQKILCSFEKDQIFLSSEIEKIGILPFKEFIKFRNYNELGNYVDEIEKLGSNFFTKKSYEANFNNIKNEYKEFFEKFDATFKEYQKKYIEISKAIKFILDGQKKEEEEAKNKKIES
ncbi:MAG: hypothetical protein LBJ32_02375 [Oscillospiraceae bacterium]|jgi:hypothetical protein|nr:hypothetical protein [Oscillospiraceae bacterium]